MYEGIRRRAADVQKLLVVERRLRIAARKRVRGRRYRPRWLGAHPAQNGVDLLFRGQNVGNNRVRKPVEIPAYGVFPHDRVHQRKQRDSQEQIAAPPCNAKDSMSRRRQRLLHQLRFCGYVSWEASLPYSVSISRTGSSHPNRDVTLAHPASSLARVSPVLNIRARASERAAESCRTA